ncbi:hypothetical protein BJY01DRAFT_231395 [Aspergillus pseudoustus]|uniref:Xylanolytic transcriptional activator regulatory domain-containing protein n=1 Tax=Aspergillus pseudoustus TaxID=1810923 RepID=A0ABR4KVZ2_9EURO
MFAEPVTGAEHVGGGQDIPSQHMTLLNFQSQTGGHLMGNVPENKPLQRFVGDLSPEARLLDGNPSTGWTDGILISEEGVWGPRSDQTYAPASDLIETEDVLALTDLYFTNIHPVIPLLNEQETRKSISENTAPTALVNAICLIAAKDKAAGTHLKLSGPGERPVPVRKFCSRLYESVTRAVCIGTSLKKITLIRILGLLSLHHEGCDGAEQASWHIAPAMLHAQTLALHLNRPNDNDSEMKTVFWWCLWTLDRLNAAINSRPCVMNDMDMTIEPLNPSQSKSVAFDIWFRIASMLNSVIALYRPTNPESVTGMDMDYPGFEQIVEEMQGWHLPLPTLATLRIFYLATAMLSCRPKTTKSLPTSSPAGMRQELSAIQVIRYMQDNERLQALHPIPVIVYAASLALSVSYQQLRYSRLASHQEEAYSDFNTACDILQVLQRKWTSADGMLDKIPNLPFLRVNIICSETKDQSREASQPCAEGSNVYGLYPASPQACLQQNAMWNPGVLDSDHFEGAETPANLENYPFIDTGIFEEALL